MKKNKKECLSKQKKVTINTCSCFDYVAARSVI